MDDIKAMAAAAAEEAIPYTVTTAGITADTDWVRGDIHGFKANRGVPVLRRDMDAARDNLAALLASFAERVLYGHVPPGPVSDGRLAHIRRTHGEYAGRRSHPHGELLMEYLGDLLAHIDHLSAMLRDCAADGPLAVREAGYKAALANVAAGRAPGGAPAV